MKNKKTYYHLVLDRSGSMENCWSQTMVGLRNQLNNIREMAATLPDQEIFISLCIFDDKIEFPGGIVKAGQENYNLLDSVKPRGSTALYDAIGDSIRQIEFAAATQIAQGEASVVMVILTDGFENASTRYNADRIRIEMDRLRATDLWSFAFIGVDFDITSTATAFNADAESFMNGSKTDMAMNFDRTQAQLQIYMEEKQRGKIKKSFFG